MEILTRLALKRGAVTMLLALALLIGGGYTATQLRTELLPNIEFPVLSVITVYPGASPGDVDQNITRLIEQQIGSAAGLESVQATSAENLSLVTASFAFGTDLNEAQRTLENNLKRLTLPQNTQPPSVLKFDFNSFPVLQLSVSSTDGSQGSTQLEQLARDRIVPELAKIDGVFSVGVSGGSQQEVLVTLNPQKLREANLSLAQVSGVLQANNISFPSGTILSENQSVPVRTSYQISTTQQLGDMIVGVKLPAGSGAPTGGFTGAPTGGSAGGPPTGFGGSAGGPPTGSGSAPSGGFTGAPTGAPTGALTATTGLTATGAPAFAPQPIKLSEVATIVLTDAAGTTIARTNGQPALGISISKSKDGNTVEIAKQTRAVLAALNLPASVRVDYIQDQSGYIEESINGLIKEGLIGALFAVLVIFLFLRNVRSTIVTAVSIPASILLAFLLMGWQNLNLNIFTLGGIAIAVGRVVDDSIVVLENIFRHVQQGEDINEAAYNGTREVASAITSSTLTTVAVFLPLGLVGGLIGQIFLPFALTVTFALLASLLVALTVIPVLARIFINTRNVGQHQQRETWLQRIYTPTLNWSLRHRKLTMLAALVLFVGSIALVPLIPTSFLPQQADKLATMNITPAPGGNVQSLIAKTEQVERILLDPASQVEVFQSTISSGGQSSVALQATASGGGSTSGFVQIRFKNEVDLNSKIDDLRRQFGAIAGDNKIVIQALNSGPPTNRVQVIISGEDSASLRQASDTVVRELGSVTGLANLTSDVQRARPEISVQVDPNKAILSGQTTIQLALAIRQALTGQVATRITLEGSATDVRLAFPADALNDVEKLKQLPIGSSSLTLGDVATVTTVDGPVSVTRYNQKLAATISGDITAANTGPVQTEINSKLAAISFPEGVTKELGGAFAQSSSSFNNLILALPIAVLLVYLIMVIVFGSLIDPFVILFSLPLASVGAFPALFITNRPIGISALIGILLLIGIVVTNAIVLVDLVQQLRQQGMRANAALLEAGRTRIRPILMTAVATILALMPLALGFNQGSLIAAELATVVIGGLLTSTLLTLIVVPVAYSLVDSTKGWFGRIFNRSPRPVQIERPTPVANPE